jgi:hypothetical protein
MDFVRRDIITTYSMALMLQVLAEFLNCIITLNVINPDGTPGTIIFNPNYFFSRRSSLPTNATIDIYTLPSYSLGGYMNGLNIYVPPFNILDIDPINNPEPVDEHHDPQINFHAPHGVASVVPIPNPVINMAHQQQMDDDHFEPFADDDYNEQHQYQPDPQNYPPNYFMNAQHQQHDDPTVRQHGGFKNKYLKYKMKYLNLLKQME